jgi:hypothetical protein
MINRDDVMYTIRSKTVCTYFRCHCVMKTVLEAKLIFITDLISIEMLLIRIILVLE